MPHTGPSTLLYDPPKELMKYVAFVAGVATPAFALLAEANEIKQKTKHLQYPLFVKPSKAGDSLGIDANSLVHDEDALTNKVAALLTEYEQVLVEEYVDGREFTVLVIADAKDANHSIAFEPVEFIFPKGNEFKTYALKTSELHPEANVLVADETLRHQLKAAAQKIFKGFSGVGYARMDFRMNAKGELYFLEINFTCSVFYKDGYEGSADYILKYDGIGQAGFLELMVAEGIARHARKQKKYVMQGNSIAGYGIYAAKDLQKDEVVFVGEGKAQRMVTKNHVLQNWNKAEQDLFSHYAYPISDEVYILWDEDPTAWAPQNHSCDANTAYKGLNVIASRLIAKGEELTLDYETFLDDHIAPFKCTCGSKNCRGIITGRLNNTITERSKTERKM
jgi:D-ala D-ala ligase C-terminus/SET domain